MSKSKGTSDHDWPESLKGFVERSFKQCSPRAIPSLEKQLQQIISSAKNNKKLYEINWDKRPLPKACSMVFYPPGSKAAHAAKKTNASVPAPAVNTFEDFDSAERKERRLRRFQKEAEAEAAKRSASENATLKISPTHHINDVHDWDADTIVGTCSRLEKNYLRLTSAPDPAQVRPLPVLRQTLELLKRKWVRESNYAYICDQFKSMRQDLTVQRITNNFTVEVYELHARIALETNDLGEYNQCQTQLKQLYSMGLSGHSMEFLAYRILYFLYTRNKADIIAALAAMTPEERQDPAVRHALSVRKAVATGDYHSFFKLYVAAPNMAGYLMDNFVDRERCLALQKMCKAFRPKLKLAIIASELAFEDVESCVKFLTDLNIATTSEGEHLEAIDMKAAYPHAVAAMQKYTVVDIKGQI
ncbi:hypothetical protein GGI15_001562 [Coemansia interrupta]|uniref:PCI domain-containing protein n=1 Tax=Coemansia interrupta TaxID=1126814 RepID=A0A9W8HHQ5_9FUNG|nr:hypothetical protein GGI15_001562 [Coemansia interrupta]